MSGICGIVDLEGAPVEVGNLRAMAEYSSYRGPDGVGYRFAPGAGMCHLALDTTPEAVEGEQPLEVEQPALLATIDARLDDRESLASRLGLAGSNQALSDARLVVAAYVKWGAQCCQELLGDFAIAVWDRRDQTLLLATDCLGIRPLFYSQLGPLIVFASEAQQVLQHPAVPSSLDQFSVAAFLCGELTLPTGRTMFESVRRLPAAHRLVASRDDVRIERYWRPDLSSRTRSRNPSDDSDRLREVLSRAVKDRLRVKGNVVGIALSGGLDSMSVAALAKREERERTGPQVIAGSLVFDELSECDERTFIGPASEALDLEVRYTHAERWRQLGDDVDFAPSLESPFMGWESCFRELHRGLRDRGARVVLDGVGGDEVVGGFLHLEQPGRLGASQMIGVVRRARQHRGSVIAALYRDLVAPRLPAGLDARLRACVGRAPLATPIPTWVAPDLVRRTGLDDWLAREADLRRPQARRTDSLPYGLDSLGRNPATLWLNRRASRDGLEPRHPFLDRRLVELMLSIPRERVIDPSVSKPLLRRALRGILPEPVRQRTDKSKLGAFIDWSLRQDRSRLESWLAEPLAARLGFVDRDRLREESLRYLSDDRGGTRRRIWFAVCFEIWLRRSHETNASGSGSHRLATCPATAL